VRHTSQNRRATKAETRERRDGLLDIIEPMRPMTVRQVFYQATVRGIVEKSEAGYDKVNADLAKMRRAIRQHQGADPAEAISSFPPCAPCVMSPSPPPPICRTQ
jgi:hypothetical protein